MHVRESRQQLLDKIRVAGRKWIDKTDAVENAAILKIFYKNANAGPPSGSPQHCIPECEVMLMGGLHGLIEIGSCARLDRQHSLPAFDESRGHIGGDACFSCYDTEEFSERL